MGPVETQPGPESENSPVGEPAGVFPKPPRRRRVTAGVVRTSLRTRQKVDRALELVVEGRDYKAVAQDLGCSREYARRLVQRALAERVQDSERRREENREIMLARLDAWILALDPQVKKNNVYAIKTLIELEDRRAKLLGLDAPVETKHTVEVNASDHELASRAAAYGIALGAYAAGAALAPVSRPALGAGPPAGGVPGAGDPGEPA